jgi:hypothetical protein
MCAVALTPDRPESASQDKCPATARLKEVLGLRRSFSAMCAVLLATCLAACGRTRVHHAAQIVAPGFTGAGVAYPNSHEGTPYVFGDIILCLNKPGLVTLTSVEPVEARNGIRIDDFAVIPNGMESGEGGYDDNSVPIARIAPQPARPATMRYACPADFNPDHAVAVPQMVALLLQYSKTTDLTASSTGVKVHYKTGGRSEWISLPWEVTLCAKGVAPSGGCLPDGG